MHVIPFKMLTPSKKIFKTCILSHEHEVDKVLGLPMNHPSLRPLVKEGCIDMGIDYRASDSIWSDTRGKTHLIFFVTSGHLKSVRENLDIGPGEVLVVPAGREKRLSANNTSLNGAWIHLARGGQWDIWETDQPFSRNSKINLLVFSLIETLATEILGNTSLTGEVLSQKSDLLLNLLREDFLGASNALSPHDRELDSGLKDLWGQVASSLHHPWTVRECAQILHLSESHFHREVMRLRGQTPMEIITEMRMERASALLKTSSAKLSTVAADLGYSTPYAFSNAFKKYTGLRPGSYRRKWS